jgi:acyl-CoA oxidase
MNVAAFETLALGDLSMLIKFGVQFGLWGGAVLHLTRIHHERYLKKIASLELPGAFAMTETGHGSNVQGLETTATFDPATQEFVIHTPRERARNEFIGNAAQHGRMAAVFAQLIVADESHGVHALVVPLRDEDGSGLRGRADRGSAPRLQPLELPRVVRADELDFV